MPSKVSEQPNSQLVSPATEHPEEKTCVRLFRRDAEIHIMPWSGDRRGTVAGYVSRRPGECLEVSLPCWAVAALVDAHETEEVALFDSPAWPVLSPAHAPRDASHPVGRVRA